MTIEITWSDGQVTTEHAKNSTLDAEFALLCNLADVCIHKPNPNHYPVSYKEIADD